MPGIKSVAWGDSAVGLDRGLDELNSCRSHIDLTPPRRYLPQGENWTENRAGTHIERSSDAMKKFLFAILLLSIGTSVHAQAEFYKGKTIRLVIGYSAGGTNDLLARASERCSGKQIHGHPECSQAS